MAKTGLFGVSQMFTSTGSSAIVITTPAQRTQVLDISGAIGNTVATWTSMTFVVAQGTLVLDGDTLRKGSYTFQNDGAFINTLPYDATGSIDCKILVTNP